VDVEHGRAWSGPLLASHIFVKELLAAKSTVEACIASHPGPLRITLGVDNTAAAHALRNGYSSNQFVMPHIRQLHQLLQISRSTLHVVSIRSEDNASDAASRGRRASNDEVKTTSILLAQHQLESSKMGLRANVYDPSKAPRRNGIRHDPHPEDDESLEAEFFDMILDDPAEA